MTDITQNTIIKLKSLVDLNHMEFTKKMIPSNKQVYGIKSPQLKLIVKDIKQEIKNISAREKIELAIQFVHTNIFEMGQMAYDMIGNDKHLLQELTNHDLGRLNYQLDNWASVDAFGVYVHGKAWRQGTLCDQDLLQLVSDENLWQRRLAVVSTVALNRKANGGTGDAEQTLMICKEVVEDYEDLVVKALSWALRELSKQDQQVVKDFIDTYDQILHNRVLREVNNKLNYGLKNPTI